MPPLKDQQPQQGPAPRSAARSWSRVQSIDKQIARLTAERAEIVKELEQVLKPQQS